MKKAMFCLLVFAVIFCACVQEYKGDDGYDCQLPVQLECMDVPEVPTLELPALAAEHYVKGRLWLDGEYVLVLQAECGVADGNTVECLADRVDLCTRKE